MVSTKCLQYCCFAYNILYAISGITIIACSIILLYKVLYYYREFVPGEVVKPIATLFAIGWFVLISCWFTWKIITRRHQPHIIMFFILLIMVVVIEFSIGIWSFVEYHRFPPKTESLMEVSFQEYDKTNYTRDLWNSVHSEIKCCGLEGPGGFRSGKKIPTSCCIVISGPDGAHQTSCPGLYQRGCVHPVIDYLKKEILNNSFLAIGISILQACGIFSYFFYIRSLRRDSKKTVRSPTSDPLLNSNNVPAETSLHRDNTINK